METGALAVRATGLQSKPLQTALLGFLVLRMLAAKTAVLAELELLGRRLLVFGRGIVSLLALTASKGHDVSHHVSS
ncbi:protein of unknown function [Trichlorobacter ammonificans]|uniref:Secreted protein n=1 Tax=Trichlorobacter ammonificans TaxID=2916410 RepID=A0ABN8HF78_9BACT|nr:protein of unknown function [Trichlorobacter ammonificans]